MVGEQAAEVSRGDPEAGAELSLGAPVERAVDDELNGPTDQLRADPADGLGHPIGPAAMTCPVAGRLGGGRQLERADVVQTRACHAPRPAVDAGGHDRGEVAHHIINRRKPAPGLDGCGHERVVQGARGNARKRRRATTDQIASTIPKGHAPERKP